MDSALLESLSNGGALVASVAGLAWYVIRREQEFANRLDAAQKEVTRCQEARVDDAQKVGERLLTLTEKWHAVMQAQDATFSNLAEKIDEMLREARK